jgi:hypothetical protein
VNRIRFEQRDAAPDFMALKIQVSEENGEKCIAPDTMKLLLEFKDHQNVCDECEAAVKSGTGNYCATGASLFHQLLDRPDVKWVPES